MPAIESRLITQNTQLLGKGDGGVRDGNPVIQRLQQGKLVRVMGPCSLTSSEQIEEMLSVIGRNIDAVRAPGKKPRTRPVSPSGELLFEGIGLTDANQIYTDVILKHPQILFASEVMSGQDLLTIQDSLALPWVGSRTQGQEVCRGIGEAARIARLPVMVKNPLVADLELMMGMMENTILGAESAIPIILCLRGTAPTADTDPKVWRNKDNSEWIPVLKAAFPQLRILLDPSHMLKPAALTPHNVLNLVEKAVDLGADGYVIELNTPKFPSITDPGTDAEETLNLLVQKNIA